MNGVRTIAMVVIAVGVRALAALAVAVTWRVVRWIRRVRVHVNRAFPHGLPLPSPTAMAIARERIRRTSFRARMVASHGPRRQALSLRRDLWSHVDIAQGALATARTVDAPIGDLPHLTTELRALAHHHDQRLVLLTERSSAGDLEMARAETIRITEYADRVSDTVIESLHTISTVDTDRLAILLDHETQAVKAGSAGMRALANR
jgi:hypothetical protein